MTDKRIDSDLILHEVGKEELFQQINKSQEQKRIELDILNCQEFCEDEDPEGFSCARTRAVMVRAQGSCGHLKVTKVKNNWGPQTANEGNYGSGTFYDDFDVPEEESVDIQMGDEAATIVQEIKQEVEPLFATNRDEARQQVPPEGIEERLLNLEWHLRLYDTIPTPYLLQERFKNLDFHILCYEAIHPEDYAEEQNRRVSKEKLNNLSTDELQQEMMKLKKLLMGKASKPSVKENGQLQYNISTDELLRRTTACQKLHQRVNSSTAVPTEGVQGAFAHYTNLLKRKHNDEDTLTDPSTSITDCGSLLQSVEFFQGLTRLGPIPKSLYKLVKSLEDRVMALENLTPRIFELTNVVPQMDRQHKRIKIEQEEMMDVMT